MVCMSCGQHRRAGFSGSVTTLLKHIAGTIFMHDKLLAWAYSY
jgi:hypothetical protein